MANLIRLTIALSLLLIAGCAGEEKIDSPSITPTLADYSRPLPPGASALKKITDPAQMPDFAAAFRNRDVFTLEAMDQRLRWFAAEFSSWADINLALPWAIESSSSVIPSSNLGINSAGK